MSTDLPPSPSVFRLSWRALCSFASFMEAFCAALCRSRRFLYSLVSFMEACVQSCVAHGGLLCSRVLLTDAFVQLCVAHGGLCAVLCRSWKRLCSHVSLMEAFVQSCVAHEGRCAGGRRSVCKGLAPIVLTLINPRLSRFQYECHGQNKKKSFAHGGRCAVLCRSWRPLCSLVSLMEAFVQSCVAHGSLCAVSCHSWVPLCSLVSLIEVFCAVWCRPWRPFVQSCVVHGAFCLALISRRKFIGCEYGT